MILVVYAFSPSLISGIPYCWNMALCVGEMVGNEGGKDYYSGEGRRGGEGNREDEEDKKEYFMWGCYVILRNI
jgi:hypothetical protein